MSTLARIPAPASLPSEFQFGVATAAFQIEGAWDADGKGPSIWDVFAHDPDNIRDGSHADIACQHYDRYTDDVALLRSLGVDSYRMSLSWARLLPEGTGTANSRGLDFYDRLIDELLEAGIAPNVTLYHWDLPQALQDRGGWPHPDATEWFADYARLAFDRYADRVTRWATFNEPISLWVGYALGWFAPGLRDARAGRQAQHNALVAHGLAVQAFRSRAAAGEIGIVLDIWKRHPRTASAADIRLAEEGDDDGFRFFFDPLLGGGYSDRIRRRLSEEATFPEIRENDLAIIAEPIDYLGLNVYGRVVVNADDPKIAEWAASDPKPGGNFLDNGSEYYPQAAYEAIQLVRVDYGWTGPVFITENGMPDPIPPRGDPLADVERIRYVEGFLREIARAIDDGADVRGYYLWTLLDNFEWSSGYSLKYGLFTRDRVPKASAAWYRDVIAAHRTRTD